MKLENIFGETISKRFKDRTVDTFDFGKSWNLYINGVVIGKKVSCQNAIDFLNVR